MLTSKGEAGEPGSTAREWRVVLVEDDEPLAGLLVRYLKRLNLEVAACFSRPSDALQSLRQERADLLITDLTLGVESGAELARSALALNAGTRVLLMSGYPYEPHGFPLGARLVFLLKPFQPNMLQDAIRLLLEDSVMADQDGVRTSAASNLAAKLSPDSDHN